MDYLQLGGNSHIKSHINGQNQDLLTRLRIIFLQCCFLPPPPHPLSLPHLTHNLSRFLDLRPGGGIAFEMRVSLARFHFPIPGMKKDLAFFDLGDGQRYVLRKFLAWTLSI
jgi:hypothetical protein